jgi:LuxR family maltose regulon positive regulatory protein
MPWLAFAYLRAGRLRLVEQECLETLALVEQTGEQTAMTGYVYSFLANTYYAWNRLEEAAGALYHLLRIAQTWQQADLLIAGHLTLSEIELARGNLASADQALFQAEVMMQREQLAAQAFSVMAARVRYWLATGDLDQAAHWGEEVRFSPETWSPNHKGAFLMRVQVALAQQQYAQAVEALEHFSALLDQPGDSLHTIHFLALYLVALHARGKHEQAQAVAARLFTMTVSEGNLRVYLDLGTPMKQVLKTLHATPFGQREQPPRAPTLPNAFLANLLAAFEQEQQKPRTLSLAEPTLPQTRAFSQKGVARSSGPVEPLTRREQEVLRLLAAGASNQEIASALVISLATVKKHVSNLLLKLGAASRTQAIARAREVSLL